MGNKELIGFGVVTFERPRYFVEAINSVVEHLLDVVDHVATYDDGSGAEYDAEYEKIYADLPRQIRVTRAPYNRGVAHAKNQLLKGLYDAGCEYFFLMEDDQRIKSPGAVTRYIEESKRTGCQHFNFAHHGPANDLPPIDVDEYGLEIYPACVGAYSFYTREVIDTVGFMDETCVNAYEHVIYTLKIAKAGLTHAFWRFPDIPDSRDHLEEQPGGITNSAIRKSPEWHKNRAEGEKKFYAMLEEGQPSTA